MIFEVFCPIPLASIGSNCSVEEKIWQNVHEQIQLADNLGFATVWFADSHSSPLGPTFDGEVRLESDFLQFAVRVLSATKQIGVGVAALNILSNGGPVTNAGRILQLVSMCGTLSDPTDRRINVIFSDGTIEDTLCGYGILPRNELETMVWKELQPFIFREAMEVFLRVLRGDILRTDHLIPCVLLSSQVQDQANWPMLLRALNQRANVRSIDDHHVQFPLRFVLPEQSVQVITKPMDASCLQLSFASTNPLLQQLANKWLPVQVAYLSASADEVVEQTHVLMKQFYHPSGGQWKREYMRHTVLVFLNADSNFAQSEQNQAAHQIAVTALREHREGAIFNATSLVSSLRNIVWGCPSQVAAQLRNGYHPQDRLILWFEFSNHDSAAACRSMQIFMKLVVPLIQDERALHLLHPESMNTNSSEQEEEHCQLSSIQGCTHRPSIVQCEVILIVDLLPPMKDVNEAQWTSEWLKSSSPNIETQIFNGIDGCWPTESELTKCLGVVITGSTYSCVNDYPHTEPLFAFFKTVIRLDISVLAICYSAQMLVRWLAGKENVVRLSEPHIGFIRIEPLPDRGIGRCFSLLHDVLNGSVISVSAQSDGFVLPDAEKTFSVQVGSSVQETWFLHGASATKWKYQAFQLFGLPVWGVQFHPNWPLESAEAVFRILQPHNPSVIVERQGTFDENGRRHVADRFLFACRQHTALKRLLCTELSSLKNLHVSDCTL